MKLLYATFYIFGKIVGFVGSWTDATFTEQENQKAYEECAKANVEQLKTADDVFAKTPIMHDENGIEIRRKDFDSKCEWLDKAPKLKEPTFVFIK